MSILEAALWLALNVYHEARDQPLIGQRAVAHVTLNRAKQKNLPIKTVVLEPGQFSWTKHKKLGTIQTIKEPEAFKNCCKAVLMAVLLPDVTNGSTHFHAKNIRPYWAKEFQKTKVIGDHIFYKEG